MVRSSYQLQTCGSSHSSPHLLFCNLQASSRHTHLCEHSSFHCNSSSNIAYFLKLGPRSCLFNLPAKLQDSSKRSMASAIMAIHSSVVVSGLGSSSMLRSSSSSRDIQALRAGPARNNNNSSRQVLSPIRAAKLPRGVDSPRDEPKLPVSFWGFTENAEVWNSRASLIGIFGIIIVEAIINKGILQSIGIEVGKGLDLPL